MGKLLLPFPSQKKKIWKFLYISFEKWSLIFPHFKKWPFHLSYFFILVHQFQHGKYSCWSNFLLLEEEELSKFCSTIFIKSFCCLERRTLKIYIWVAFKFDILSFTADVFALFIFYFYYFYVMMKYRRTVNHIKCPRISCLSVKEWSNVQVLSTLGSFWPSLFMSWSQNIGTFFFSHILSITLRLRKSTQYLSLNINQLNSCFWWVDENHGGRNLSKSYYRIQEGLTH